MTPRFRRLVRFLGHRGVPRRTRVALLLIEVRRRLRPRPVYTVPLGQCSLPLTHDDFLVDWLSLEWVLISKAYETDYEGAVVLDIGAHKGYVSAYAVAGGARSVIAYEPEARNFELLEQCAASHGAQGADWLLRRAAVGAESGEAELHVSSASWGHALHPPDAFSQFEVGVQLGPIVAMADVLAEACGLYGGEARLIVKINTEGEECATVLGTPPDCWRSVDEVLIETHPWADCGADQLGAHLERAGLKRIESSNSQMLHMRR